MSQALSSLCLVGLMSVTSLAAMAEEHPTAKALFYSTQSRMTVPDNAPSTASGTSIPTPPDDNAAMGLGLRYYIRLRNRDGSFSNVLASRIFRSHEQFQIGLDTAGPTYIYVLNEDNTGQKMILFPKPGQSPYVNVTGTVFLPSKGCFEFDGVPSIEKMTILMSRREIKQLENYYQGGTPDLVIDGSKSAMQPIASKGIAFSDDSAAGPEYEAATYVIKQQATSSDLLHIRLKLIHQ